MYCIYCGTQLSDQSRFCTECGQPQVELSPAPIASNPIPSAPAYRPVQEKKDNRNTVIAVLGTSVAVLAVLLVISVYLNISDMIPKLNFTKQNPANQENILPVPAWEQEIPSNLIFLGTELAFLKLDDMSFAVMECRDHINDFDFHENEKWNMDSEDIETLLEMLSGEQVTVLQDINTDGPCLCWTLQLGTKYYGMNLWKDGTMEWARLPDADLDYTVLGYYQADAALYQKLQYIFDSGMLGENPY